MHPEWPLILFTFFLCVAGGALGAQGLLNVMGKGKKMQLASLVTALAALVVGGLSVFMHLQHWERIFNGFGHITSGITLEFIDCIVFAVVLVLYFLMMRRAEDGMAPKWCGDFGSRRRMWRIARRSYRRRCADVCGRFRGPAFLCE